MSGLRRLNLETEGPFQISKNPAGLQSRWYQASPASPTIAQGPRLWRSSHSSFSGVLRRHLNKPRKPVVEAIKEKWKMIRNFSDVRCRSATCSSDWVTTKREFPTVTVVVMSVAFKDIVTKYEYMSPHR